MFVETTVNLDSPLEFDKLWWSVENTPSEVAEDV